MTIAGYKPCNASKTMTDKFTKSERSNIMAAVRGRGNKSTEMKAIQLFREKGITGWRRHLPMIGRPDFAFPKQKLVVFIDGCFWHGCPRCYRAPQSSAAYWNAKIEKNKKRDRLVNRELRKKGWRVIRIRECQLKSPASHLSRIIKACAPSCKSR